MIALMLLLALVTLCRACTAAVLYCCRDHQTVDEAHAKVCDLLAWVQAADAVEVSLQRERQLLDMFPKSCKVGVAGCGKCLR